MAGYANPIIHLNFNDLSDSGELLWVAIKNPKLQTPDSMRPSDVALDDEGKPATPDEAVKSMYHQMAALVVAWHIYEADVDVEVDETTGDIIVGEAKLMPKVSREHPATPAMVRLLPTVVINKIGEEMKAARNPQ